jgi:kynurenine formamidase
MKSKTILLTAICCFALSCANQEGYSSGQTQDIFSSGQWIDLSYDFSEQTNYWTENDGFKKETVAEGRTDKGYFYSAYKICAPEHGGTHIDSPVHFAEGRRTTDQIPLDQLIGKAIKIDVSTKTASNRDYLISVEDLTNWENANGRIPDAAIVLFQTGYGKFWGDRAKYMGVDAASPDRKHFPGLSKEAASWLVQNRKIKSVGIDTASIDFGQSETFDAHQALMEQNVPAFENVANLDKLPAKGLFIVALPMKIKGGSGAPLRIVAFLQTPKI